MVNSFEDFLSFFFQNQNIRISEHVLFDRAGNCGIKTSTFTLMFSGLYNSYVGSRGQALMILV